MRQQPPIGVGIEWHPSIGRDIMQDLGRLDCVEIIAENFFFHGEEVLDAFRAQNIPVLIHAVEMSLGSADSFRQKHFDRIKEVAGKVNAVNFSDHLAWCTHGTVETLQPAILPFNREAALAAAKNIKCAMAQIDRPFLIENEANRYVFPRNELSEPAFFNLVMQEADCGLLLDLTNLHTNAVNFGIDPYDWLAEIDLSRVQTIHLAGGTPDKNGVLIDSHDAPVPDEVWDMLRFTVERVIPPIVILERNDKFPPYEILRAELNKAKAIVESARGLQADTSRPEARV